MHFSVVCLSLLILGASTAFAQEYDIIFHRITKAGTKMDSAIRFNEEDVRQITVDGQAQPENKVTLNVQFSGLSEEVEVAPDGNSKEAKIVINHCTCSLNGQNVPLLTEGDVFVVKREAQEFTINGKPVEGLQLSLLKEMFPSSKGYAADSEDQTYAPKHKVKVGDTWPVNPDLVISDMAKKGITLTKNVVTGTVKLDSANPLNNTPCLQVSSAMTFTAKDVPMPDLPPTMKCTLFKIVNKENNDLPVDRNAERFSQRLDVRMETESSGTMESNGRFAPTTIRTSNTRKVEAINIPAR
jgi:hypothetical protein